MQLKHLRYHSWTTLKAVINRRMSFLHTPKFRYLFKEELKYSPLMLCWWSNIMIKV